MAWCGAYTSAGIPIPGDGNPASWFIWYHDAMILDLVSHEAHTVQVDSLT